MKKGVKVGKGVYFFGEITLNNVFPPRDRFIANCERVLFALALGAWAFVLCGVSGLW